MNNETDKLFCIFWGIIVIILTTLLAVGIFIDLSIIKLILISIIDITAFLFWRSLR